MNTVKRALALVLCMVMVLSYVPVHAHAADGNPNVTLKASATEVNVGDTFKVTVGHGEMHVASFAFGFDFDTDLLEVSKISVKTLDFYDEENEEDSMATATEKSTKKEANESGHIGVVFARGTATDCYAKAVILEVTFTAKAAGTAVFEMFEDSSGTDGYKAEWTHDTTVTIIDPNAEPETSEPTEESKPACEHTNKTTTTVDATCTTDGSVTVTCDDCGETVSTEVLPAGHTYGDLIPAEEEVHTETELKPAVAAHYHCVCGKYFDVNKAETTLEELTGKTPEHTVDPTKTTTETTSASCTEEGKTVTETFCACGKLLSHTETTLPVATDCSIGNISYTWSGTSCTAEGTCQYGEIHKEEVTATSEVTTKADCQTAEVVTYTATFTADWAVEQTKTVTGEKDMTKHVGTEETTCKDNGDGTHTTAVTCACGGEISSKTESHDYKDAHTCVCGAKFTGWEDKVYYKDAVIQKTGWTEIEGAWYYLNPETGVRAEGLTRVPYPTAAINGITYAPDAEALAYCESKGTTFIDAAEAWFDFGDDGKFNQSQDFVSHGDGQGKLVDGMLAWHPGLFYVGEGEYVYFIGDAVNGGNIGAEGDTYITKNNGIDAFKIGDIYNFKNASLSGANGIVDGKYYEDSRLMAGNGLTKVGDKFIYVRYNGKLVVGAEYYVPANTLGVVEGMYTFDENGFLVNPELSTKDGIVAENGGLYFYENGKIAYGVGLIEYNGKVIYVRSNGKLAVGEFYVTNVNNYTGSDLKYGDKLTFDDNGFLVTPKNGIVAENGTLYYYDNGNIAYGAGLIYLEDEGCYIYVRSNGQLATGIYWPTTTNGYDFSGRYDFGTDGKLYI